MIPFYRYEPAPQSVFDRTEGAICYAKYVNTAELRVGTSFLVFRHCFIGRRATYATRVSSDKPKVRWDSTEKAWGLIFILDAISP